MMGSKILEPDVTVILPAYNAAQYISETIDSVLNQSYQNFELLVIDDGSTDNTADLVRAYVQQDSRVQIISQPNQGVSAARNHGIDRAVGEFLAFLDADDLWVPDKLEAHVRHLCSDDRLGMSFARIEYIDSESKRTGQKSNLRLKNIQPQHFYQDNLACTPSNVVIRRVVLQEIGGFDSDLSGLADIDLFLRVSCSGWTVEGLDEVLVYYRFHPNGMSSQLKRMEDEWHRFNAKVAIYNPSLVQKYHPSAEAMVLRSLARQSLRFKLDPDVGIDFINRALSADWKLILNQPKRTLLTLLAVYGRRLTPMLKI
jgi:glycosyltransferase involved in cell wall biosynthesis